MSELVVAVLPKNDKLRVLLFEHGIRLSDLWMHQIYLLWHVTILSNLIRISIRQITADVVVIKVRYLFLNQRTLIAFIRWLMIPHI